MNKKRLDRFLKRGEKAMKVVYVKSVYEGDGVYAGFNSLWKAEKGCCQTRFECGQDVDQFYIPNSHLQNLVSELEKLAIGKTLKVKYKWFDQYNSSIWHRVTFTNDPDELKRVSGEYSWGLEYDDFAEDGFDTEEEILISDFFEFVTLLQSLLK